MTEALAAAAPYLIIAALSLLVGAAIGYATACTDALRPRYRRRSVRNAHRVGRPE